MVDDIRGLEGGQRDRVDAGEQREAVVIEDAGEDRIPQIERPGGQDLPHHAPFAREQIVQGDGLSRIHVLDFPDREPCGALGLQPRQFFLRTASPLAFQICVDDGWRAKSWPLAANSASTTGGETKPPSR